MVYHLQARRTVCFNSLTLKRLSSRAQVGTNGWPFPIEQRDAGSIDLNEPPHSLTMTNSLNVMHTTLSTPATGNLTTPVVRMKTAPQEPPRVRLDLLCSASQSEKGLGRLWRGPFFGRSGSWLSRPQRAVATRVSASTPALHCDPAIPVLIPKLDANSPAMPAFGVSAFR